MGKVLDKLIFHCIQPVSTVLNAYWIAMLFTWKFRKQPSDKEILKFPPLFSPGII